MSMKNEQSTSRFDGSRFDIAVVGGGIAGLVAGITASESGARVVVIDAHAAGGRACTTERDGFYYNIGPHALYLAGHLQTFLAARTLDPSGGIPDIKRVRLLRDDALHRLSMNPFSIAATRLLRPRSRVRLLSLLARVPRMKTERFIGLAWQDFLGNEPDDVAGLLSMLVRTGTYVNAPETFDSGAALDQLKLALKGVRYVDGGWQTIVDSLVQMFARVGGTLLPDTPVTRISSDGDVVLETSSGVVYAHAVVIAGLAPATAERLTGGAIRGGDQIGSIVHAAVLDLALDRVHDGLVFGIDEALYLTPHAPVARLAPNGCGLVSILRYVPGGETQGSASDDRNRLSRFAEQAGITKDHVVHERYLHRLVVANGFPTASGGGVRGRPTAEALGIDGVFVAGDWVGPAGQLADAASASAEAAARHAIAHSARRATAAV
ncbi:MAG: FAD-dependent oxidoreductase [Ilumatobacteraceae bacterium]